MSIKPKPNYTIRCIQLTDCDEVRDIWSSVGFMIFKYGNEVMMNTDKNGILVAQHNDSGKIIGVISGVNLSPDLSFIGQYAVRHEYQGLGIGKALWDKAMAHMGDRNIGIFAAKLKMFEIYRDQNNFKAVPQRHVHWMRGRLTIKNDIINQIAGICLVQMSDNYIEKVIEYDRQVCDGLNRGRFLRSLYTTPDNINLVAINGHNQVVGYCFIGSSGSGVTLIAPLYADNETIAELLVGKCCGQLPDHKTNDVLLKCWDNNQKANDICVKLGLKVCHKQYTAFNKKIVYGNEGKIYAITSTAYYPF